MKKEKDESKPDTKPVIPDKKPDVKPVEKKPDVKPVTPVAPIGPSGKATTTRYWDCSGGACGCGFGDPSNPSHCSSNALFKAPASNAYGAKFYGTAAISDGLGGGNWLSEGCGKCFKVSAKANIDNHTHETTLILKAANYCPPSNAACSGGKFHFDIAAPGFDWAGASDHMRCDSN